MPLPNIVLNKATLYQDIFFFVKLSKLRTPPTPTWKRKRTINVNVGSFLQQILQYWCTLTPGTICFKNVEIYMKNNINKWSCVFLLLKGIIYFG